MCCEAECEARCERACGLARCLEEAAAAAAAAAAALLLLLLTPTLTLTREECAEALQQILKRWLATLLLHLLLRLLRLRIGHHVAHMHASCRWLRFLDERRSGQVCACGEIAEPVHLTARRLRERRQLLQELRIHSGACDCRLLHHRWIFIIILHQRQLR